MGWLLKIQLKCCILSGQKYEFPAFTGKIMHMNIVCTRPFLPLKGPGYEARVDHTRLAPYTVVII